MIKKLYVEISLFYLQPFNHIARFSFIVAMPHAERVKRAMASCPLRRAVVLTILTWCRDVSEEINKYVNKQKNLALGLHQADAEQLSRRPEPAQ